MYDGMWTGLPRHVRRGPNDVVWNVKVETKVKNPDGTWEKKFYDRAFSAKYLWNDERRQILNDATDALEKVWAELTEMEMKATGIEYGEDIRKWVADRLQQA